MTTQQVLSPYDQSIVAEVPMDPAAAVETKLEATATAFRAWSALSFAERADRVGRAVEALRENRESIAADVTRQMGKPITQARSEVDTMLDRARQSMEDAPVALAPDALPELPGFVRRIEHAPLGVVFNIAAWNYPLVIPINVIVPALLAGNTVLFKHSARTPLTGRAFEAAFQALEVPGALSHLVVDHETTSKILADARVAHVAFTGSVAGGAAVHRRVGERFIDAGLELGGKDPAYVAEDADLDFAAANIVDGACYNAGQSCCGIERVYVHRSLYESFLEKAKVALETYVLGDPREESTTMGPLASAKAPAELQAQVDDARKRGARLLLGGQRPDGPGNFYEPTLIVEPPHDAPIMQEESFGPLVPVIPVSGDDEAVRLMNDTRFGLTASVWTADLDRAERLAAQIQAGTVFQNRADYLDPMLPWTGWGESGKGSTLSRYGFLHLTRRKSIHFRTSTR